MPDEVVPATGDDGAGFALPESFRGTTAPRGPRVHRARRRTAFGAAASALAFFAVRTGMHMASLHKDEALRTPATVATLALDTSPAARTEAGALRARVGKHAVAAFYGPAAGDRRLLLLARPRAGSDVTAALLALEPSVGGTFGAPRAVGAAACAAYTGADGRRGGACAWTGPRSAGIVVAYDSTDLIDLSFRAYDAEAKVETRY
jgi:hypothetical protein